MTRSKARKIARQTGKTPLQVRSEQKRHAKASALKGRKYQEWALRAKEASV